MAQTHPAEILRLPSESFAAALRELDPASRALLDLSLRRGMHAEEIAELLGADAEAVVVSRDHAFEHVATSVGARRKKDLDHVRVRLAELPAAEWTGLPNGNGNGNGSAAAAASAPTAAGAKRAPQARPILVTLLVLCIAGVVIAIALGSGGGRSKKPAPATPAATGHRVALRPMGLAPHGARGHASLNDGRLTITASGLVSPRGGGYEVWLYNSVIDAQPLGSATGSSPRLTAKLPPGATRYRFVDVSLEPNDGNPSHSGESVLRVPLARLERR